MPSNYSGNPANITTPITRTITNCAAGGGLVEVTTSVAHLFSTFDYVYIAGVTGTTEANGTFQITVITSTTFRLVGVPFVNAYIAGGSVDDLSLTPYFEIPDDGEAGTAQSIEASIQNLADRTAFIWLNSISEQVQSQTFTANGSWVAPRGVTKALLMGFGGGGGGGSGADGTNGANDVAAGGGGGAGALLQMQIVTVVPATSYAVTIGTGGAGGAPAFTAGVAGNSTTFGSLAEFRGGSGGAYGPNVDYTALKVLVPGGIPTFSASRGGAPIIDTSTFSPLPSMLMLEGPSNGGSSGLYQSPFGAAKESSAGNYAPNVIGGAGGGAGGAAGANTAGFGSGAGGGGGGGGPNGNGGAGGAGGAENLAGAGAPGAFGNPAGANSGAGGGGGGGGGRGTTTGGGSGDGDAGGSGMLVVLWVSVAP